MAILPFFNPPVAVWPLAAKRGEVSAAKPALSGGQSRGPSSRGSAMLLKLVVSLLPLSSAYVILPGMHKYNEPAFAIRWNSPTKRDTWPKNSLDDGLAGGLTFAYSPSFDAFCNGIMDQMKENTPTIKWANCEEIENAVMRAMATWEANHQAIKFVDVTQACTRETMSQDMTKCSLAEIVITSGAPVSSASTVAALVTHYSETWGYPTTLGPSSTAGMRATKDYTIEKVRHRKTTPAQRVSIDNNPTARAHALQTSVHFNNHICWYLDNTFCGSLHATQALGFDVKVFSGVVCIGLWLSGILMLLKALIDAGDRIKRQVKRRNMRLRAAVEVPLAPTCCSTVRSYEQAGPAGRRLCSMFPIACRTTSSCFFYSSFAL